MDKKFASTTTGGVWQCIAGPDFGSFVTHEEHCFAYFYMERPKPPRTFESQQLGVVGDKNMIGILIFRT